ncbi:MAG: DUF126 domain-containing protein [Candidatus Bathyarchaeia archaeon]
MKCRRLVGGYAEGYSLVSPEPISFFGGVDPSTGIVIDRFNPIRGESIAAKIFVFPRGKGSTVGSYTLYRLAKRGFAPKAMICLEADPVIAVGAVLAGIPLLDKPESYIFKTGMYLKVYGDEGFIEIVS